MVMDFTIFPNFIQHGVKGNDLIFTFIDQSVGINN